MRAAAHRAQIREETQLIPLLEDVGNDVALAVRQQMEDRPWLRVVPCSRRESYDADSVAHVLGRLGAASPERIANDPFRGDELRALKSGERCGVSGVEYLAEAALRGTRGRIVQDYNWQPVERQDPVPGRDVDLTIDLDLQQHILGLLEQAVSEREAPAGAAAVVIDAASREVRALVSYPTYSYENFGGILTNWCATRNSNRCCSGRSRRAIRRGRSARPSR